MHFNEHIHSNLAVIDIKIKNGKKDDDDDDDDDEEKERVWEELFISIC